MRLVLLCLLALLAAAGEPRIDAASGFRFPDKLADGSTYLSSRRYQQAGLGYSVRYQVQDKPLAWLDLYVYDLGRKDIGDGPADPAAQEQFAAFADDLRGAVERKTYRAYAPDPELARQLTAAAGDRFLSAAYRITFNPKPGAETGTEVASLVLLTAVNGRFLKVRCSYPPAANPDLAALARAVAALEPGLRGAAPATAVRP